MPVRLSRAKPTQAADSMGDLTPKGFRIADSDPHTNKTLMLQEREPLLAAEPADAAAKAYSVASVDEKILGKSTHSVHKKTASRLTSSYGLDAAKPLFSLLRRLWFVAPIAHPLLALHSQVVCPRSCVWDLLPARAVRPTSEEEG
jgi:hypothetical protein